MTHFARTVLDLVKFRNSTPTVVKSTVELCWHHLRR